MGSGNLLVDEMKTLNENIILLNSKIDKLQVATDKVVANTTAKVI